MKHWYPQTSEVHLEDRGVTIEFRTALEIYKAMLSNPALSSHTNGIPNMDQAIQIGIEFCRKFNETNS